MRGTVRAGSTRPQPELIGPGEGLVECPTCHGHVGLVNSPYTDSELGIVYAKTKVLGSHLEGGKRSRGTDGRCIGSLTKPKES